MEKSIELTSEEKMEFERRGFFVKNRIHFDYFIKRFIMVWILFSLLFFPYFVVSAFISGILQAFLLDMGQLILILIWIYMVAYILVTLLQVIIYLRWVFLFYTPTWVLVFWKKYSEKETNYRYWYNILEWSPFQSEESNSSSFSTWIEKYLTVILMVIVCWLLVLFIETVIRDNRMASLLYVIPWVILFQFFTSIIVYFIFLVASYFYPLNTFWALWQKIQSLTPKISEQSRQIELEFRWDMDFRVLSKSFDSLASTFSQIMSLVVRLEQVEKKANKWDLFDSAKYINSLREDIRTPLLSLKEFLEKKKVELESSQRELMKVRVNVWGEQENRELQSVRSQELGKELEENIMKIGEMTKSI